jgi:hypothetical protein
MVVWFLLVGSAGSMVFMPWVMQPIGQIPLMLIPQDKIEHPAIIVQPATAFVQ